MSPEEQMARANRQAHRAARLQHLVSNMQLLPYIVGAILLLAGCVGCGALVLF